jgi:hypothetical protein
VKYVVSTQAAQPIRYGTNWASKRDSMISVGFKRVSKRRLPSQ